MASIEEDASRGPGAIRPDDIWARLGQGADPWAGLGVFYRSSSRCSTCHQINGRGGSIGPDLTMGETAMPAGHLIESILYPSKEISERYDPPRTAQKDGRAVARMVAATDAKPAARVAAGFDHLADALDRFPRLHAHRAGRSGGVPQEQPAQASLEHGPMKLDRALVIGPFAPGADRLRLPLDRIDLSKPSAGLDGVSVRWGSLEATAWGTFNLRGELGTKPSRTFLAVQVRSEGEQGAVLRFAAEGSARVYLNGKKVADVAERDPSTLGGAFDRPSKGGLAPLPDLARLPLQPGWNLLIIAIDGTGQHDARASFEIASPEPVELRLPKN